MCLCLFSFPSISITWMFRQTYHQSSNCDRRSIFLASQCIQWNIAIPESLFSTVPWRCCCAHLENPFDIDIRWHAFFPRYTPYCNVTPPVNYVEFIHQALMKSGLVGMKYEFVCFQSLTSGQNGKYWRHTTQISCIFRAPHGGLFGWIFHNMG